MAKKCMFIWKGGKKSDEEAEQEKQTINKQWKGRVHDDAWNMWTTKKKTENRKVNDEKVLS